MSNGQLMGDFNSFLLGAAAGMLVIGFSVKYLNESPDDVRQDAIKSGVAEYQVNPATGETKFVWKKGDGK